MSRRITDCDLSVNKELLPNDRGEVVNRPLSTLDRQPVLSVFNGNLGPWHDSCLVEGGKKFNVDLERLCDASECRRDIFRERQGCECNQTGLLRTQVRRALPPWTGWGSRTGRS